MIDRLSYYLVLHQLSSNLCTGTFDNLYSKTALIDKLEVQYMHNVLTSILQFWHSILILSSSLIQFFSVHRSVSFPFSSLLEVAAGEGVCWRNLVVFLIFLIFVKISPFFFKNFGTLNQIVKYTLSFPELL